MSISGKLRDPATLRPATQLVHGGSMRSEFAETSEALFLTQGYLYDTMEEAEARFKGDKPGFIYSRFANPTVAMFERRMALLEGAESARATASGMAAVTAALMGQLKAGDHIVAARALFGSCLYVVEELRPVLARDRRWSMAPTCPPGARRCATTQDQGGVGRLWSWLDIANSPHDCAPTRRARWLLIKCICHPATKEAAQAWRRLRCSIRRRNTSGAEGRTRRRHSPLRTIHRQPY